MSVDFTENNKPPTRVCLFHKLLHFEFPTEVCTSRFAGVGASAGSHGRQSSCSFDSPVAKIPSGRPQPSTYACFLSLFLSFSPLLRCCRRRLPLRLFPLPFLRRKALGGPGMYGRDLCLEGCVHETMSCEGGLLVEKGRDDSCFEGLAASACAKVRRPLLVFVLDDPCLNYGECCRVYTCSMWVLTMQKGEFTTYLIYPRHRHVLLRASPSALT